MQTRSIDIDFEVHKVIELERRGFGETPNEVLRRMLGIDVSRADKPEPGSVMPVDEGRPWVGKGKSTHVDFHSEVSRDFHRELSQL